jgi:hypothetical protein
MYIKNIMTKKIAVILRGYHYEYNHKPMSTFYRRYGAYTLDFERHWLDSLKKTIMNDKRFDCDYFIITNESEKLNKLLDEIKPADVLLKSLDVINEEIGKFRSVNLARATTVSEGCELVAEYCKKNNVSYDFLLSMRMDQKINRNPLDFFDYNIKNRVSVFLLYGHIFSDFIYLIPFNFNKYFIYAINTEPLIISQKVSEQHRQIYHLIKLSDSQSNMLATDRQFYCHENMLCDTFKKIIWKKNVDEYSKEELEQDFNKPEVHENLTIEQIDFFKSISYDFAKETPVEETPVEETPVEETPVEETPVEETPVEETPVEETPVEETPVEETPVEETPVEETPVEETPVEENKNKRNMKKMIL